MTATQSEILLEATIRGCFEGLKPTISSANPFMEAIGPKVSAWASFTRSLSSQMGSRLQRLARRLAELRYGAPAVPRVLYEDRVPQDQHLQAEEEQDTVVVTTFPKAQLEASVTKLRTLAGEGQRIGSAEFLTALADEVDALKALPMSSPRAVKVDLYVHDPSLGFCEIESGGNLDSSNVKSQTEKLIRAVLARGDASVPAHWCLAYANNGEGAPIAGGLTRYFLPGAGLLVGAGSWERLLPLGVTHERFLELFTSVCSDLDVLPKELQGHQ